MFDSMKAFFYKTLTTVIDDFGSMIIPMPWREFDGLIFYYAGLDADSSARQ